MELFYKKFLSFLCVLITLFNLVQNLLSKMKIIQYFKNIYYTHNIQLALLVLESSEELSLVGKGFTSP